MIYRKRTWSPSAEILVSKKNNQKFRDLYFSKMSDVAEIWAFCKICSKNLNIAHGGRNDCARHLVTNSHLEFAIVCK